MTRDVDRPLAAEEPAEHDKICDDKRKGDKGRHTVQGKTLWRAPACNRRHEKSGGEKRRPEIEEEGKNDAPGCRLFRCGRITHTCLPLRFPEFASRSERNIVIHVVGEAAGRLAAATGLIGFDPGTGRFDLLPAGTDFFLLGAFAAYSGAGGVANITLSNWARDKGYGMGQLACSMPSGEAPSLLLGNTPPLTSRFDA